jgi:hypothetical protein
MKQIIYILMFCLMLYLASAVELNDTYINSTGLNTSINITKPIYFDVLTVGSTGIYFDDLRPTASSTETFTFNLTESNGRYIIDYSRYDLPYIALSSTVYNKYIKSNLTEAINTTIKLNAKCGLSTEGYLATIGCDTCTINSVSCLSDSLVSASISNLSNGETTLTLTYYDQVRESAYANVLGQTVTIILFLGIVWLILLSIDNAILSSAASFVFLIMFVLIILRLVSIIFF